MNKKLYLSKQNKMLCGVCGGIGEYFNIDPTLIRLAWAILAFVFGSGIVVYILGAVIIPERPGNELPPADDDSGEK